jgi:hypothetical protein
MMFKNLRCWAELEYSYWVAELLHCQQRNSVAKKLESPITRWNPMEIHQWLPGGSFPPDKAFLPGIHGRLGAISQV